MKYLKRLTELNENITKYEELTEIIPLKTYLVWVFSLNNDILRILKNEKKLIESEFDDGTYYISMSEVKRYNMKTGKLYELDGLPLDKFIGFNIDKFLLNKSKYLLYQSDSLEDVLEKLPKFGQIKRYRL